MRLTTIRRTLPVVCFGVAVGLAQVQLAMAADFFAGKSISIIIGSGAGGGFDRYGRNVGRHMLKYIPGKPSLVPKNMPGAGSMKAAEYLYNIAPKDGTVIAILQPGALFEPLIGGDKKFRFDPPKFEFLGSANSGTRLCVMYHTSKVKSFEDARKYAASMGGNAPGSATTDYALMFNNLAGTKFKVVNGYKSSSRVILAMERGELDGICGFDAASFRSQRPGWYNTDKTHMIIQAGINPDAELEKIGVPSMWKYIKGKDREIAELVLAQQEYHRPFVAPPGIPADRLAILREAFQKTMKDAAFLADAKKSKLDINPKTGEVVEALIKKMYASPKDLVAGVRKALGR